VNYERLAAMRSRSRWSTIVGTPVDQRAARTRHPDAVGVQFHPEAQIKALREPFAPNPLFASFIEAAVAQSRLV
jgi:CTP synthase (UTP-ammonia lyase)